MSNSLGHILARTICIALVGIAPASYAASTPKGYVTNAAGNIVHDGATGKCVRTGTWDAKDAVRECEPEAFAKADAEAKAKADADAAAQAKADADAAAAAAAAAATAAAAAKQNEPVWKVVEAEAFFDLNAAEPTAASKRVLDDIAQRARSAKEAKLKVVGFADPSGNADANLALSQQRADTVRSYLEERGVPNSAIEVQARGESDAAANCEGQRGGALASCLQPNRRSQIELSVLEPP